jgi:hypothetical protein
LALKRYLTKVGRNVEKGVDHTINISKKALRADSTISKPDDIIPDIPVKVNVFRRNFIILACIAAIISIIVLCTNPGAGLIVLGVGILLFGLVAAFNTQRFETIRMQPSVILPGEESATSESAPLVASAESAADSE